MKVAFVDNLNNNFFSMVRYFRNEGVDAYLYTTSSTALDSTNAHFSCENDTFQNVKELDYILKFPSDYNWVNLYNRKVLSGIYNELKDYDLIFACSFSMAFLYRANLPVDVFIPTGSDLFRLPFRANNSIQEWLRDIAYKRILRKSIKKSRIIIANDSNPIFGTALKKLGVSGVNLAIPMVFTEEVYETDKWDFLDAYDFVVFNHSRQVWKTCHGLPDCAENGGNKRNDKTIRAFARLMTSHPDLSGLLVLFEYGPDVNHSKALISELSIEARVRWVPKMPRKEILAGLKKATFAVDQCRKNVVGIGGTSLESISMGVPTITNTHGCVSEEDNYYYKAPFIDILEEDEILNEFEEYLANFQKYDQIGVTSKKWFDNKAGVGVIKRYLTICQDLMNDKS
ncbi:glycosyltransferase [Roseivirga sp. E12]|uniref:glycosyltransferase n=1 Tax=Roseivirga sp. E12 TaxID=2819237 RepID=UPI001ABC5E97|nr:glycosyltransferase [Roseivirga sp. E12]MBO3699752.1 glycosyltransferase [Roseivirga sp. E12]